MDQQTQTASSPSAEAIQLAYDKVIESQEKRPARGEAKNIYASAWSACTRQMALQMLYPDRMPDFTSDTLANFRRGRDRERDLLSDLTRVGRDCVPQFEVIGGQERFELRDKKGRVAITGKVDARLKFREHRVSAPLEIKSWHPNLTQGLKSFEDLFHNRWLKKGAHQLLAYLLASNEPLGFLLLDRPGIPLPMEVRLYDHLDKIEDFLQRSEVAMDAKEAILNEPEVTAGVFLPPYIDDPSECKVCPFFGHTCNPPMSYAGAQIFVDETVIMKTERYAELDAMPEIEEHQKLDKWAKETFRGVEQGVVGKCLVSGKWQKNTVYELPDEAQAQIEAIKAPFAKKVAQGKFFLTVTKVSE